MDNETLKIQWRIKPNIQYDLQRNALRVEVITAWDRCFRKPRTAFAKMLVSQMPHNARLSFTEFDACIGSGCTTCHVATKCSCIEQADKLETGNKPPVILSCDYCKAYSEARNRETKDEFYRVLAKYFPNREKSNE